MGVGSFCSWFNLEKNPSFSFSGKFPHFLGAVFREAPGEVGREIDRYIILEVFRVTEFDFDHKKFENSKRGPKTTVLRRKILLDPTTQKPRKEEFY